MLLPKDLKIAVTGVRGVTFTSLNEHIAFAFAEAFHRISPPGPIVVSRDTRLSGVLLKEAVMEALAKNGRKIIDADVIPLPTTQIAVEHFGAAGAIDITASHNPPQYNGLKFLDSHGTFLGQEKVDEMTSIVKREDIALAEAASFVAEDGKERAEEAHISLLEKFFVPGQKLRVALDAVNGAGSYIIPRLLERMGCETVLIAADPTQPFPHMPEPTPENLEWTKRRLEFIPFDFCAVVDPDADRLVLIDENRNILSEEMTVPLVAEEVLAEGRTGPVVINLSTSMMTDDVAAKFGAEVIRVPVGESHVVSAMKRFGASFGGEGGGGVIDPEVHLGRDSLVGIVRIVGAMRRRNMKLSELAGASKRYEMSKLKIEVARMEDLQKAYRFVANRFPKAEKDERDGLRLVWDGKWLGIRPSNTEPIVRITAESESAEEAEELVRTAEKAVIEAAGKRAALRTSGSTLKK